MMSYRTAGEHARVSRGGAAPGASGPRHGALRPGISSGGGDASSSGRPECNWWGADRQPATPRRQQRSRPPARVPTGKGNRELVRRALSPPAARGVLRRWSFQPAPSRLRNASSSPSPALGLTTTAAVMV